MNIIPLGDKGIELACDVLRKGGIVVFPSDTVYGLLCDASNEQAVKTLQEIKNRPVGKPISVFVTDFSMMKKTVVVTESQEMVLKNLFPGPYTAVLPSKKTICQLLESENGTLGVRIPFYKPITDLVSKFQHPLTATSANTSGHPPFYSIQSFIQSLSKKKRELIDLVVDGGELPIHKPSTVLDFSTSRVQTLRQGDLHFKTSNIIETFSEEETRSIAGTLLEQALQKKVNKPIVFILRGEMGVGKTIFAKGLGKKLGISNIISPTFVIYYEYEISHPSIKTFIHCDLYNIEEEDEFKHLGLDSYFKAGVVLCFEWGDKAGVLLQKFQKTADVTIISFTHKGNDKRILQIEQSI